ncbi:MAG: phosphatidylserine decarboxylase family protein [Cytophagales bacterium]|nr:phosphatidylserine decarboxylase family protein [Cytophagales bacterium]
MYIHKEGRNIVLITLILLVIGNFIVIKFFSPRREIPILLIGISSIFYLWIMYFFRNPDREIQVNEKYVLAPADGKVVSVEKVYEAEYFKEHRIQISIFMSPFNVHVNRNPISGVIKFFKYHPGKYWVAWHPKSSTQNERTTIVIENQNKLQILFRQIAGFIARRIKFYPTQGEQVKQGAECGFIKFGSRVDVFLPLNAKVKVKLREQMKGGISVLAEL